MWEIPRAGGAIAKGLFLTACLVVACLILAWPAYGISGMDGLRGLGLALALCLVPGWLVFGLHSRYRTAAPLGALLVGMMGRMFTTLAGMLVVVSIWPELGMKSFGLWLGVLYILSLLVETLLLAPPAGGIPSDD